MHFISYGYLVTQAVTATFRSFPCFSLFLSFFREIYAQASSRTEEKGKSGRTVARTLLAALNLRGGGGEGGILRVALFIRIPSSGQWRHRLSFSFSRLVPLTRYFLWLSRNGRLLNGREFTLIVGCLRPAFPERESLAPFFFLSFSFLCRFLLLRLLPPTPSYGIHALPYVIV